MDTMTMEILKKIILSSHTDWCVSLFMPTTGQVGKWNRTRFASRICFERWRIV